MISLKGIHKTYKTGETEVRALAGVSLDIEEGEFIAIMGPSGSGKSTLMHIMGLLDTPDAGSYELFGKEVSGRSENELAVIRRRVIGFVFQQFNLLPRMTAVENVLLPLVYSQGAADASDASKAMSILDRLGLGPRSSHRPNQLSIGQQQRVAIARALINSPKIILADEPTGNLDSKRADEIMEIMDELNRQGITIILVTHEEDIGRHARRLIRMKDGEIVSDETTSPSKTISAEGAVRHDQRPDRHNAPPSPQVDNESTVIPRPSEFKEFFRQGIRALSTNKARTALSTLGILIGVAAVIAMLALGRGAEKDIESKLASLGSNLLMLIPGAVSSGGAMLETGAATRLTLDDAKRIKQRLDYVVDASGTVSGRGQAAFLDKNWNTQVMGVGASYAKLHASVPIIGRFFTDSENLLRERVAVVGATIVQKLFNNQNPVGETIKINKQGFRIIGVLPQKGASGWRDRDDIVVIPVLTAMHRLFGKQYLDYIEIEITDPALANRAESDILALMVSTHNIPLSQKDDAFNVLDMSDIRDMLTQSARTMSMLLAIIATISLLVGGIGIMNIMLVSVTERTREIGLRKAIGARRSDILAQFLAESVVVSASGGVMGIAIGWVMIRIVGFIAGWNTVITLPSILLALIFSGTIGIAFGMYPARKASILNPIDALRYE